MAPVYCCVRRLVLIIHGRGLGQVAVGVDQPAVEDLPGVLRDRVRAAAAARLPGPVDTVSTAEQPRQR